MKKILYLITIAILSISCQDVIELDLNNADPRLVVDARIERDATGNTTTRVLLTRTAGFYDQEVTYVNNATVVITDQAGSSYPLSLTDFGTYTTNDITAGLNSRYTLQIIDGGETYVATQDFVNTVPYTRVEQESVNGLPDVTKITGFFNDPAGEENYYLFEYLDEFNFELDIIDDEFTDGNEAITVFFMEDLPVGTEINLKIKGLDRRGFTFYDTLIQQTADGGGGPFDTQPATVRGNIINTTNTQNFALGYFMVSQVYDLNYTVTP